MKKSDEKKALCVKHRELLQILVRFGKGAMLLKQLRTICLRTGLYPNEQAVNRAARNLRAAGVLTRQTWVDGNSDLVLARKGVYEFLYNTDSRGIATPPSVSTGCWTWARTARILSIAGAAACARCDGGSVFHAFLRFS